MKSNLPYSQDNAPVIGFIMATIKAEFNRELKNEITIRFRRVFNQFKENGIIHKKSLFFENLESDNDIYEACEKMTDIRVDGIVFHPLSWPTGESITALATYRYLKNIPVFISASPEIFPKTGKKPYSWPQNSDCGKIFSNSIFYKLDRKSVWYTGLPEDKDYQNKLITFFISCQVIKRLSQGRVAVIGNVMDDFPESFYSPLSFRRELGIRISEVDTSVLLSLFQNGKYPSRGLEIDESRVHDEVVKLKKDMKVMVDDSVLEKATRLFFAYEELLKSMGAEAAAFRCAPEFQEQYGLALCGIISQLIDNSVIFSGGCEGDVPCAVTGLMQYYASGAPTTCLDWIDKPGSTKVGVYSILHCGNACKSMIQPGSGVIEYNQAWTDKPLGYTIEGALRKGEVTLSRLRENREGKMEMLIVECESVTEEALIRGNYGSVYIGEERLSILESELNNRGWPHHFSLGWGHMGDVLEMACKFLGDIKTIRI